jgi:hypothetical protein
LTPYRTPPRTAASDEEDDATAAFALVLVVLLLGVLVVEFAPRNRSNDPEPLAYPAAHGGGHAHAGSRR